MTTQNNDAAVANRFSSLAFGGGDEGEERAYEALSAHESTLTVGTKVRVYRGRHVGMEGTVAEGQAPGQSVYVDDVDGLRWTIEASFLELA